MADMLWIDAYVLVYYLLVFVFVDLVFCGLSCGALFVCFKYWRVQHVKNNLKVLKILFSTPQSRMPVPLWTPVQNVVTFNISPRVENMQDFIFTPLVLLYIPLWGILKDFTNRIASNSLKILFIILFWAFCFLFGLFLILASDFSPSLGPLKYFSRYCQAIIHSCITHIALCALHIILCNYLIKT